jgi:hypothetical protein
VHFLIRLIALFALGTLVTACGERHWSVHRAARPGARAGATARLPLRVAPDLVVRRAEFGLLETDADGEEHFAAASELPAEDGQVFGWVVELDTTRSSVRWQEHLRMPGPARDWGDVESDPDIVLSKDGKSALAQGEELVENGELSRFYWSLASGDPAGPYELDLAIEGRPVAHFVFRVPSTVREKAILVNQGGRGARRAARNPLVPVAVGHGAMQWR